MSNRNLYLSGSCGRSYQGLGHGKWIGERGMPPDRFLLTTNQVPCLHGGDLHRLCFCSDLYFSVSVWISFLCPEPSTSSGRAMLGRAVLPRVSSLRIIVDVLVPLLFPKGF